MRLEQLHCAISYMLISQTSLLQTMQASKEEIDVLKITTCHLEEEVRSSKTREKTLEDGLQQR
jgi:hypothetical protein